MNSAVKYLAIGIGTLLCAGLLLGFLALSDPTIKGLDNYALINQSNQSDLIISVHERFVNSVLQMELEERRPDGVKNVSVYFDNGGPVEVLAELEISLGIVTLYPMIRVDANLSAENNTLKVVPEDVAVGKLNIPKSIWIGPLNDAIALAEDAANQSFAEMQRGFKILNVYINDQYLTLAVDAPPPEELKDAMQQG